MNFFSSLSTLCKPLPSTHERRWIPHGTMGTAETIDAMQNMVDVGKREQRVRELAGKLISQCPKKDYFCYAKAIFDFCQTKIQYAFDPVGVEWVENPTRVLDAGMADCDSICVTFASLCETIGLPCRFVTVKADSERPDEFSHVFCEVKIPKRGWLGADPTMPQQFGWKPEGYRRQEWPASKDAPEEHGNGVSGMSGLYDFTAEKGLMPEGDIQVEESAFCQECPSIQYDGPQQDFFLRQKPEQNFLTGLGASPDPTIMSIFQGIYDGTYAQKLRQTNEELNSQNRALTEAAQKVRFTPGSQQDRILALVKRGRENAAIARQNLIVAQGKYNFVVDEFNRYGAGLQKSSFGMSGMGFLPAWAAPLAVTSLQVGAAALALSVALSIAVSSLQGGRGIIADIGDTFEKAGVAFVGSVGAVSGAVTNFSIVVLLGLLGYVGFAAAKKKGWV
jgi:hypothetical protein